MTTYKARCIEGYTERIRTVIVDRRLQHMPAAQAGIIENRDGGLTLMSYATPAATLSAHDILHIYCLCSATTRSHVSAFLRECAPGITYQDAKRAYTGNYSIDIKTGDHISNETGEILNAKAIDSSERV